MVALERPGVVVESEVVADDLIAAEQIVQRSREERIATLANAPEDTWVFLQEAEPVIRAPSLGVVENPKYVLTQEVLVVRVAKANLENSLRTFLGQMEKEKQPLFSLTDVKAEVSEVLGFEAPVEELEGAGGSIPPVSVPQSVRFVLSFPVQYYTPLVSGSIVTKDLRGKNEHAILDILREQYGIQDAGVVFRPEWLGRFATYFGPIKVTVLEP